MVTETRLTDAVGDAFTLAGYAVVARRDRKDRDGGGVCVFARSDITTIACLEKSDTAERCWLVLHTNRGPLLLGAWYWAP